MIFHPIDSSLHRVNPNIYVLIYLSIYVCIYIYIYVGLTRLVTTICVPAIDWVESREVGEELLL